MMTDCVDTVETPVLWCDKKKNKKEELVLKAVCFLGFPSCTKAGSVTLSWSTSLAWLHELQYLV